MKLTKELAVLFEKFGWEEGDEISVEMAGTQISGIHQPEGYNKKWSSQYGNRKINKDAFIVIKNQDRRDLTKSQPMDREHLPHHLKEEKETTTND